MIKEKHIVEFYSPGTFFFENSSKEISDWSVEKAILMSQSVVERYGAKPYAFRFYTLLVSDPVPDGRGGFLDVSSKEINKSKLYYLGGEIKTIEDIKQENNKDNDILLSNMDCNYDSHIVVKQMGRCRPFFEDSCIIDSQGNILAEGNDLKWKKLRDHQKDLKEEEYKKYTKGYK